MTTQTQQPLTVHLTPKAAEKVRFFAQKEGLQDQFGLRVWVKAGGCSGLTYQLAVAAGPQENDKVIEEHGVKLFVDKRSYVYIAGMTLDFSDGLNGKGFTFSNPNAKRTCGCGTSFSV